MNGPFGFAGAPIPEDALTAIRAHHRAHEIAPHWYDLEDGAVSLEDLGAVMAIEAIAAFALFTFRGEQVPPILAACMKAALVGMEPDPSSFMTHVAAIAQMRLEAGDFGTERVLQVRYVVGLANALRTMVEILRSSERQWGPKTSEATLEETLAAASAALGADAPPRRTIFVDLDVDPFTFDPALRLNHGEPSPFIRALASLAEDGDVVVMVPTADDLARTWDLTDELKDCDVKGSTVVRGKQPARQKGDVWVALDQRRRAEFESAGLTFYTPDELVVAHARFEDLRERMDGGQS